MISAMLVFVTIPAKREHLLDGNLAVSWQSYKVFTKINYNFSRIEAK